MPHGDKSEGDPAAASLRVVRWYLHARGMSIETARDQVLEAGRRVEASNVTPEIVTLVARLEKVTGVGIAELAKAAKAGAPQA